ncbi:dihydrofolate reductase family protein [Paenibacillus wynnii]|uniref:Deaminase n=1 Tax=Paenibacillus wynnii TaxID=268407 RepID=A0A098M3J1_9BACL|nr:dihydrofolate reductase family protein [Paenibacillus wynnii]KGE17100.1 deaminase [Paenibacillus wynnii]
MGRVIMMMNVTLDGCCDHTHMIADEEVHRYTVELIDQSDGLLFGREIYQLMERFWPDIASSGEGPQFMVDFAHKLNQKPKYVVSRTLDHVSWQNSFLLKGPVSEEVPKLIGEGKNLLVNGGPGLGSTLVQLDLVDEFHFLVNPIVAGRGPQLLGGVHERLKLKLTEAKPFGSDVVLLRYTPVR